MSRDFKFQSPVPTIVAIALFSALYLLRIGVGGGDCAYIMFEGNTLNEVLLTLQLLAQFESENPTWAVVIATLLLLFGALRTMKIASDFNLYSQVSHLPAILYLIPFAAFATPTEIIAPVAAGLIMTSALEGLFGGYNHFSGGAKIFRGCFWLGVLPLIYPSMLIFLPLLIGVVLILDRGGRDLILMLGGYMLPMVTYLYVWWLLGASPNLTIDTFVSAFVAPRWELAQEWGVLVLMGVLIGLSITSIVRIDEISIALVARTRLTFTALVAVVGGLLFLAPSFTAPQLCVLAIPIALTLTAAFYEFTVIYSTVCYITIVILMLLVRVLP